MKNDNVQFVASYSTIVDGPIDTNIAGKKYGLSLNARQDELYGRLMSGLKWYEDKYGKDYLFTMNSRKKGKIKHLHHKAMQEINLFKQQIMIARTNSLQNNILELAQEYHNQSDVFRLTYSGKISCRTIIKRKDFALAGILQLLQKDVEPDPTFKCTLRFEDLHITKHDIIDLFIIKGILPSNFYELS